MVRRTIVYLLLVLLLVSVAPPEAYAESSLKDIYTSTLGVYMHAMVLEPYFVDEFLHVNPPTPGSPPKAIEAEGEHWIRGAASFEVVKSSDGWELKLTGKGGWADFMAVYLDNDGVCRKEIVEFKPIGVRFDPGQEWRGAMDQVGRYVRGINLDDDDPCRASISTLWKKGEPGWHMVPERYYQALAKAGFVVELQTWYNIAPGVVFYRVRWRDDDARKKARSTWFGGVNRHMANLIDRIAKEELGVKAESGEGRVEIVALMRRMLMEDMELDQTWRVFIDARLPESNDGPTKIADNAIDPDILTVRVMGYLERNILPRYFYGTPGRDTGAGCRTKWTGDGYKCA